MKEETAKVEYQQILAELNPRQQEIFKRELASFENSNLLPGFLKIASRLNPEQLEAVFHEHKSGGPLLILACAGSGKTTALVYRIIYLILKGVEPSRIIALTFTVKAAEEMRLRIRQFVNDLWAEMLPSVDRGPLLAEISKMWMGTFHSNALRILKENIKGQLNCELVGLRPGFGIVNDNSKIIREAFEMMFTGKHALDLDEVVGKIEHVKNELLDVESFKKKATRAERPFIPVYERYQELLRQRGAIDFSDMIINVVNLFRRQPDILEHYQKKFRYILVDEYQDTNYAQYIMCKMLVGTSPNFFCVGDDDQSIYGWRGADVRNIIFFEKDYPNATRVKLVKNYRSTATIIGAANEIFRKVKPKHLLKIIEPLRNKYTGHLDWGEKISVYHAYDDQDEIKFVSFEIERLKKEHPELKYSDFAILYRTNFQNKIVEKLLNEQKIPCTVYDPRFWSRPEVKNLTAYLKVVQYCCLFNSGEPIPKDLSESINETIKFVLKIPPALLKGEALVIACHLKNVIEILTSDEVFEKIMQRFNEESTDARNLKKLRALVNDVIGESSVGEAVKMLLERSGLISMYEIKSDLTRDEMASYKIYKNLITDAADFEKNTFAGSDGVALHEKIGIYLDSIAAKSKNTEQSAIKTREDTVNIMTIHSAKGLEFDTVFFIGLEDTIVPLIHFETKELTKKEKQKLIDEERRLFYVGVTRAKKRLYLTYADERFWWGGKKVHKKMSPFLKSIPKKFYVKGSHVHNLFRVPWYMIKKIIWWFSSST